MFCILYINIYNINITNKLKLIEIFEKDAETC